MRASSVPVNHSEVFSSSEARLQHKKQGKERTFSPFPSYLPKPQSGSTTDHRENAADCILIHTEPAVNTRTHRG